MTTLGTEVQQGVTSKQSGELRFKERTAAGLLAEISTDPFVFLQAETRRKCIQSSWRWVLRQKGPQGRRQGFETFPNLVVRALLRGSDGDLVKSWRSGSISKQELKLVESLDLSGCGSLADLSPIVSLPELRTLILRDCIGLRDLSPIRRLKHLEVLNVDGCCVDSLVPVLAELKNVKSLILGGEIDLKLLDSCRCLEDLHLHYSKAHESDLSALAGLEKLKNLCVPTRGEDVKINEDLRKNPAAIKSEGLRRVLSESPDGSRLRRTSMARNRRNLRR